MKNKGIIYAFIASIISGIAIFYAKISVTKIDPLILTTSRNMVAGSLLVLSTWFLVRKKKSKKLESKDYLKLFLISIIGGAIPFYLFFSGLKLVEAQTANLIQKSLFIWVSFLALVFLKERPKALHWFSFFLIFFANFYFAKLPLKLGKGELMIFAATILWSIEYILAKKLLKDISSEMVGIFRMIGGSLVLLFTIFLTGQASKLLTISYQQLTIIVIGGTILSFYVFFWLKALKYAAASLVTLVLSFSLVVGNILNGVFAGVKILPIDIFTSLIVSLSIFLCFVNPRKSVIHNP